MTSVTITLPYPPKVLHPNGRTKRPKYRRAAKRKWQSDCMAVAFAAGLPRMEACRLDARWFHPQRRFSPMDDDNLTAWLKYGRDAIAEVMRMNDKAMTMGGHGQDKDLANPRVELTITERTDDE